MKPWPAPVRPTDAPARPTDAPEPADDGTPGERARRIADLEQAGIELDPARPGLHRHGDVVHEHAHAHPHLRSEPGERPYIGIVGAGAVGRALGVALQRAGWPVAAIASRDAGRREAFQHLVPGARAFAEATAIVDETELIILCVPDDAIAALAGELRLYSGQAIIHTSGVLGSEVLAAAMAAGTQAGGFHPLVAFTDTERSVEALHGAAIAIEGDEQLASLLGEMAEDLGAMPVRLLPGTKPAYHAAAVLAAGGFVALLDAIAELGRVAGLDEAGSLAVYGRLVEQTLGNARALGIRAALTGPMTRGDVGTLAAHLAALRAHAPAVLDLYLAVAEREIQLGTERGALAPEAALAMRQLLASGR
jgi:predicted short-subunit dehydrogenase-like oxidoreductase (DUF2520 family)